MSIPVRRSIRLPDFDYTTPGAYFITMCTHARACLFGDVVDGVVRLNGLGKIVQRTWDALPEHFAHVELDQFVIMPNHVHGIVVLNDIDARTLHTSSGMLTAGDCMMTNGDRVDVGAKQESSASPVYVPANDQGKADKALALPLHGTLPGSLCAVVQNFKSVTTRKINNLRLTPAQPVWQRNYYEHVIRNDRDLAAIRDYIDGNPVGWLNDENYPRRANPS